MFIRSAERRRVAELVSEHYNRRRVEVDRELTAEKITHYAETLADVNGMTARIAELEAAKRQVESLQHSLLESACKLKLAPPRRKLSADELRNVVKTHGYGKTYDQVLNEVAKSNLTRESGIEERKKQLFTEEQQRLAELALVTDEHGLKEFFQVCQMVLPSTKTP